MSWGGAAWAKAPWAGSAAGSSTAITAGTLHAQVHVVAARSPVQANTLHTRVHTVTASTSLIVPAHTLHAIVHLITARAPEQAGTLHAQVHLVPATAGTSVAGTLHLTVHLQPTAPRRVAVTLHTQVHLVGIGAPHLVVLPVIARAAVAYAPLLSLGGHAPPTYSFELVTRAAPSTVISTLEGTYAQEWLDQLNDVGSGSLTIDNDDADYSQIVLERLVRFKVKGVAAFLMLIESLRRHTVAPNEEIDENTEVTGRGHLAILEEAVVYPPRGTDTLPITDDRVFNWTAPNTDYDDTSWGPATEIAQSTSTYWTNLPDGWPSSATSAWWIWASSGTQEWAPTGTCYFRRTFTVPVGVSRLRIYVGADDAMSGFLEGAKFASLDNDARDPHSLQTFDVDVSAGDRTLAFEATNEPDDPTVPPMTHNPAGLRVAVFALDNTGVESSLLLTTDSTWKIVEYPPFPPGMTPGQVLRIVVAEAQARGSIPEVTLAFSDSADSAGEPWPNVADIATKVGTDLLTFFKEIVTTYIDMWMDPSGFVLYAWNTGGRGNASNGVSLHTPTDPLDPATGNLTELEHLQVI